MNGVPVHKAKIRDKDNLRISLESADVTGVGQFSLADNQIESLNEFQVEQAKYKGQADSSMGRALIDVLTGLDAFALAVNVTGDISSPSYKIDSDLDGLISKAIAKQLKQKLTQFQNKLQSGLNEKVAKALKMNKDQAGELADIESLLNDSDKALDKLLKSKLADNKKKELEDKLKKKLGKLFG